jgi:hypothetical protein
MANQHIAGADKLQLSDLELMETLGTGTFGRVRLCKHPSEGSSVAPGNRFFDRKIGFFDGKIGFFDGKMGGFYYFLIMIVIMIEPLFIIF